MSLNPRFLGYCYISRSDGVLVIFFRLKTKLLLLWLKLEFQSLLGRVKANKISGGALNSVSPPLAGNQILYWMMEAMLPISC